MLPLVLTVWARYRVSTHSMTWTLRRRRRLIFSLWQVGGAKLVVDIGFLNASGFEQPYSDDGVFAIF